MLLFGAERPGEFAGFGAPIQSLVDKALYEQKRNAKSR